MNYQNQQMLAEGYRKIIIRYYFVNGNVNHQVWAKNKAEVYSKFPYLKGKKLVYNRQETKWVK